MERTAGDDLWSRLREVLSPEATAALGEDEGLAWIARLDVGVPDILGPLRELYGHGVGPLLTRIARLALRTTTERPTDLRRLDRRREVDREWFQQSSVQGYVCYVDRFCGTLAELPARLDYLAELGTTYLHLMPLLKTREGENDGGYAVVDYRAVDPALGTMQDLESVAAALRERGMSLCIDLVLNHTAAEHPWARGWLTGDPAYVGFYRAFPDRSLPDAYDATIASVFPDRAPGSFTWVDAACGGAGGWVWTTFWPYQWDLDYENPEVTVAMLGEILWLANRGVEIFRLDAVPFMWKRLGTNCQNQPEVHLLMQLLRAVVRVAAPAVIFKAEAIVSPDDLVPYLGGHERYRPECDLAYHNQLMVMLWSSLATREARLASRALARMTAIPPQSSWVTYVRCHDDIGWAVSDTDAASVGWDAGTHRRFLNDFYAGRFPGSFARGALFQEDGLTGDARISGSAAALCGISDAQERGDPTALRRGIRRLALLHAVTFGFGGVPLVYMGDELALGNDVNYLDDPELAADNRWMHRPPMDWAAAELRLDRFTVQGQVFGALRDLSAVRRTLPALRAGGETEVLDVGNSAVLAWRRKHPRSGHFVGLANVSDVPQTTGTASWAWRGDFVPVLASDPGLGIWQRHITLPAQGYLWVAQP